MIFSKILDGNGNNEIGLRLVTRLEFPDCFRGITVAIFQSEGKMHVVKICSNKYFRRGAWLKKASLSIFDERYGTEEAL